MEFSILQRTQLNFKILFSRSKLSCQNNVNELLSITRISRKLRNLKFKCDRNICNSPVVEVRFALGGICTRNPRPWTLGRNPSTENKYEPVYYITRRTTRLLTNKIKAWAYITHCIYDIFTKISRSKIFKSVLGFDQMILSAPFVSNGYVLLFFSVPPSILNQRHSLCFYAFYA